MASVNAVELPVAEVWNHRRTHCEPLNYSSVINYERCYIQKKARNCVMCGRDDTTIPRQNKDVCKACDSSIWLIQNMDLVVKFCKGLLISSMSIASGACSLIFTYFRLQKLSLHC